jgi:predicted nucleic-acid-binding Zn-ribbon protein
MEEKNFVTINNKQLKCLICENTEFIKVYTKLNEKWASNLGIEIFSSEGVAYICKNCGYKHEFYKLL